jgi:hypothetical protein
MNIRIADIWASCDEWQVEELNSEPKDHDIEILSGFRK